MAKKNSANDGIRRGPYGGLDLSRSWISSGHLDPSTIPQKEPPAWDGWKKIKKGKRDNDS